MKINWNSKYNTISVYTLIVIFSSIIFYFLASQIGSFSEKIGFVVGIMYPFIIGFVIAYLLNFILEFYEYKILGKIQKFRRLKRGQQRAIGLTLTYLTTIGIGYLSIHFILPQLIDSIMGFINDIPQYVDNLTNLLNELVKQTSLTPEYASLIQEQMDKTIQFVMDFAKGIIPVVGNTVKIVASSIWNIVLGLIISVYLLIDKENFFAVGRKITCALFSRKVSDRIFELTYRSNETFGKFLSGKIIDSAIIGALSFVIFTLFKIPYTLLIAVIIGVTNIIPFFGPFIGAIPALIIILFASPSKALVFLVLVFIIQQLDGNIIGPKILGDSIGISAFWILFSILVAGKLLGLVGMIIGVPLFAILYSIIKEVIESKLRNKSLPIETEKYMKK